jgi:hypothetical protein
VAGPRASGESRGYDYTRELIKKVTLNLTVRKDKYRYKIGKLTYIEST